MPCVFVTWTSENAELIGRNECSLSPDMLEHAGEVEKTLAQVPERMSVDLQCKLEAGDEDALVELLDASLAVLRDRLVPVASWGLSMSMPRFGTGRASFAKLFAALPPCQAIRLSGLVKEALCALPSKLRDAFETIELRECGAAFDGVSMLHDAVSLKSIEITGANNVLPPWSSAGFEGFLALKRIRLDSIATLQTYRAWVAPACLNMSRQIPVVEIGDVNLPQVSTEEELGDHVRFGRGSEHARPHWFRIAPSFFAFTEAQNRGVTEFVAPSRCHVQMLSEILGTPSRIRELDCRRIEGLRLVSPDVWMPEKLGLDTDSREIRIMLPALGVLWNPREPQVAQDACDSFIESLERTMMQPREIRGLRVALDGPVSTGLRAWKWLLDESESRLTLDLADTEEPLPAPVERGVCLDLANPSHQALCRLLAKRGLRAEFLDRLSIVGSLAPDGHKLLEQVFDAVPGLKLHIDAHLTGGAEWLMGSFEFRALQTGRQVTLSTEVQERVASLDLERRQYEGAAAWALREVAQ
jgi:hypothetical protein